MGSLMETKLSKAQVIGISCAAVVALTVFAHPSPRAEARIPAKAVVATTWDQVSAEYNQNALAFEHKYANSAFALSGKVVSVVGSDTYPVVQLQSETGTTFLADFNADQSAKLATLKQHQGIKLMCQSIENGINMQECALQ